MTTLYVRENDGFQEASAREVLLHAQELIDEQFRSRICVLDNIESLRLFFKVRLGAREHEVFAVVFLDTHRRAIEYLELFRGTIDIAHIHPREVVKEALKRNAAAVVFAHNHPSGVCKPSEADGVVSIRLRIALGLVGVKVIDHFIVGESVASMVELGILRSPLYDHSSPSGSCSTTNSAATGSMDLEDPDCFFHR
jgi:DNA repair protein RadC